MAQYLLTLPLVTSRDADKTRDEIVDAIARLEKSRGLTVETFGTDGEPPTVVVFRKWRTTGDVIALFPNIAATDDDHCSSFEHIGQHGASSYHHVISQTRPATPEEYAALRRELESAPYHYHLTIRQRR